MRMRRDRVLALLALVLAAVAEPAVAETPEIYAEEALNFFRQAQRTNDPNERGRLLFIANLRIRTIRSEFPRHPIAAQMAFGRYGPIDIAQLERQAAQWRAANPQAARAAEFPSSALVPQFGAPAGGQQPSGPLVPNFGAPPPNTAPSLPTVPSFGAAPVPNFGAPASGFGQPSAPLPQFGAPPAQPSYPGFGSLQAPPAAPSPPLPGAPAFAITLPPQESKPLPRAEVVERLRRATVIVWYTSGNSSGHGTGFFISPTQVMTNTHVVMEADKDRVVLANKVMGVRAGRVLFKGMNQRGEGVDTAIIELVGPPYGSYLPFAANAQEGESVAVAGYPGTPLLQDRSAAMFFELLKRNQPPPVDAIPNVRFDFGTMQGVYIDKDSGVENIQMGINVTSGSSGSAIVNQCGQVVAQHYSGSRADVRRSQSGNFQVDPARFSYAISFRALLDFQRRYNVVHTVAQAPCLDR